MRSVVIIVSKGKKGHKISVNGIRHGIEYSSPCLANKEATELKDRHYPTAKLFLASGQRA